MSSKIEHHCQHCGNPVPYHGPWKSPEDLLEYATEKENGLHKGDIIFLDNRMGDINLGEVGMRSSEVIVYGDRGGSYTMDQIVKWMPAPERI